jgi:DNA-binding transcriptional ArsR family regulator
LSTSIDEDKSKILKIASNPHRLQILDILSKEASNLGKLAKALGISRQLTSHHVEVLVSAGLVKEDAMGAIKIYSTTPKGEEVLKQFSTSSEFEDRGKPIGYPSLARLAPPFCAILVLLFVLYKYLTSSGAPISWLIGGAIASMLAYVIISRLMALLGPRPPPKSSSS